MKIVIIGTGNVATVLGSKLLEAGHDIVQVYGRNAEEAKHLALQLDANPALEYDQIKPGADLYLVAIADAALPELHEHVKLDDELIVHTAGSVMKDVLKPISKNYGVLYPLQSLRKNKLFVEEIPLMVDANNEQSIETLKAVAASISDKVTVATDIQRLQMHLAAVIVNNFVNNLYVLAEQYCKNHDLDFTNLMPLIKETITKLPNQSPQQLQTGPAMRNDLVTIEKHLDLLKDDERLRTIYQLLTQSIKETQRL